MLTLFKAILLCAVCTLAAAKYFDWKEFEPLEGDKDTIVWDVKLETLNLDDGSSIKYVYGTLSSKKELQPSIQTHYLLKSDTETIDETHSVCNHTFHDQYLGPYGPNAEFEGESKCPLPPTTIKFKKVNSKDDLTAPSKLSPGRYNVEIRAFDEMKTLGGFRGQFDCFEDS